MSEPEITKDERDELRRLCKGFSELTFSASCTPDEGTGGALIAEGEGFERDIVAMTSGIDDHAAEPLMLLTAAALNALPRLLDALDRAEAERDAARAMAAKATEFAVVPPTARMFGTDALLVAIRPQRDDSILWAVCRHGYVLNKSGEWEWELMPSSRDEEFLARCRFPTLDAAWVAAEAAAKRGGRSMKFRKKPVVIEATRYEGPATIPAGAAPPEGDPKLPEGVEWMRDGATVCSPYVRTLEGNMRVTPGDWIITGVKGERYPCKPDIFEATYEAMSDPIPPTHDPTASAREWAAMPDNEARQSVDEQLASDQSRHSVWGRPMTSEALRIARRVLADAPALLARLEDTERLLREARAGIRRVQNQPRRAAEDSANWYADVVSQIDAFLAPSTPRAEGPSRG